MKLMNLSLAQDHILPVVVFIYYFLIRILISKIIHFLIVTQVVLVLNPFLYFIFEIIMILLLMTFQIRKLVLKHY